MRPEIDDKRLARYLAGECTDEERREIEAWMKADAARKLYVEELRAAWRASSDEPSTARDVDRMWNTLRGRIRAEERRSANRADRPPRRERRPKRKSRGSQVLAVAAIASLAVALVFIIDQSITTVVPVFESDTMHEVVTQAGQRSHVTLKDGSRIVLNADSRLTWPAGFADDERIVHLHGEAYFDVFSEEDRPFMINVDGAVTEVLGTKFNIEAYPDEPEIRVVVDEGRVAVRPEGTTDQETLLEQHQLVQLNRNDGQVGKRQVDVRDYLAWIDGYLVFADASLDEIARKLARWYGLDVVLEVHPESVDRLNASFQGESPAEVLDVITHTLNLRYERDGHAVVILPPLSTEEAVHHEI